MAISEEKRQAIHDLRKKQILDAALKLFDEKGFSNTKITDISDKAGISKGLVYHYFATKEDILYGLVDILNECLHKCSSFASALEGVRTFGLRLLSYPYYQDYVPPIRVFFSAMIQNNIDLLQIEYPIKSDFGRIYFGNLFRRGQEQGEFKEGDPELFGDIYWKYLLGSLAEMCITPIRTPNTPDLEPVLQLFIK